MIAAKYLGPGRIEPTVSAAPEAGAGEAVIQVEACGICGTDLNIYAGAHPRARPPVTVGHEFCGKVVRIGASTGSQFSVGDRVVVNPLIRCGKCWTCRHNQGHACRNLRLFGIDVDGGMAEFVKLPVASLLPVPQSMPPEVGAMMEPLAVAVHAVSRSPLSDVDSVLVTGAGPIGLVTALVARHRGAQRVWISDVLPYRLALARQLGFTALDASQPAMIQEVLDATDGEGVDLMFEASGVPAVAPQITSLVRPQGTVMIVGVFKYPAEINLLAVNFKELTLIGTRCYTDDDFREAIRIAPELPLQSLISHQMDLSDAAAAFEAAKSGKDSCKVILKPGLKSAAAGGTK